MSTYIGLFNPGSAIYFIIKHSLCFGGLSVQILDSLKSATSERKPTQA